MVPGFSINSNISFLFPVFLFLFCFSSQFLRSLNAFWSWGWPGNLRSYTNAPEIQNDWIFFESRLSLVSFLHFFFVWLFSQTFFVFGFELTQALNQVSFSLPPLFFFLYYCYLLHMLMNWFPLPHLIQGVLGLGWGWNFLTYKNYRSFCQNLSVYFINKCLLKVFSRRCPVFQLHNSPQVHKCLLLSWRFMILQPCRCLFEAILSKYSRDDHV